jgi:hypothetical protein
MIYKKSGYYFAIIVAGQKKLEFVKQAYASSSDTSVGGFLYLEKIRLLRCYNPSFVTLRSMENGHQPPILMTKSCT